VVVSACIPSTWEAEARGLRSLRPSLKERRKEERERKRKRKITYILALVYVLR
jgi:hypothetical protein